MTSAHEIHNVLVTQQIPYEPQRVTAMPIVSKTEMKSSSNYFLDKILSFLWRLKTTQMLASTKLLLDQYMHIAS